MPRSKADAIRDIDNNVHTYYVPWRNKETEIRVVPGSNGRYLRTDRDGTNKNSLEETRHCVLLFDEFDTVGKERGDEHETGELKRVVSSLLLQIDHLPSRVLVVAATNPPELLDRAAWPSSPSRPQRPAMPDHPLWFLPAGRERGWPTHVIVRGGRKRARAVHRL